MNDIKRVNFGAGPIQPETWINIDEDPRYNKIDTEDTSLITTNSVDYIVAHHSLQCIAWSDLRKELEGLHRILKPDGILRISIPDIIGAFEAYERKDLSWFPSMGDEILDERFSKYLSWYSTNITPLTGKALCIVLKRAGFKQANIISHHITLCEYESITELDARFNESVYIEAVK